MVGEVLREDLVEQFGRTSEADFAYSMPGVGRFRVNLLRQRSSLMIVLRVIPFTVPTLAALGAPELLGEVASAERGLVIIAGLGGAGKSSTIAAMMDHINREHQRHVVTIENPSLGQDLRILIHTLPAVIRGTGAF